MAVGTGVHNLSLVVRAHNRASRALAGVGRDLSLLDKARKFTTRGLASMANIGAAAIKTFAIVVAGGLAAAVFAFSKFDQALQGSLAIAGEVSPELRKELSDTAREIAKVTQFSARETAEAYYFLLSAGLDVQQSMKSLPVVASFAQAGLMDLSRATEVLTDAQSALGRDMEDPIEHMREMTKLSDILIQATKSANATTEQFAESLTNRAASTMRTYNIEVEEGVAVLAAWADQGLKGRTAGEAFSNVVRDLLKAQTQNTEAWRKNGLAVVDAEGNLRSMADILGDIENAFDGLSDAQKKQMLQDLGFQERTQQRLLQLLGTSDAIREYTELFREAGGVTQEVAEKQLQTAFKQFGLLKDEIVDVFIGIGELTDEGFVNLISRVREWVSDSAPRWIESIARTGEKIGELIDKAKLLRTHFELVYKGQDRLNNFFLAQFGSTMQFVIRMVDDVIRKWTELRQPVRDAIVDWAALLPWIFLIAGAFKIVGVVLAVLGGPATIVAGIIAALVIGIKYLWENTTILQGVFETLAEFWEKDVVPVLEKGWEIVQAAAEEVVDWFEKDMLPFLEELWEQIKDTFQAGWDFVVALFEVVIPFLEKIWEKWGTTILTFLRNTWENMKAVVLGAFRVIEGIFQIFTGILTGDWRKLWEGIKNIFGGIWDIISTIVVNAWENMYAFIIDIWNNLRKGWSDLWNGFKDVVRGPLNTVIGILEGFFNAAIIGINGLIGAANKMPGVSIDSINRISIPRLALGGDVIRSGLALVGENGPELLALGKGAQVSPLGSTQGILNGVSAGAGIGSGIHIDSVIFQGTPTSMLDDWRRHTKLAMRGL